MNLLFLWIGSLWIRFLCGSTFYGIAFNGSEFYKFAFYK